MSEQGETFFTVIGCMDGRCQEVVVAFGKEKFGRKYADTITEPGLVGLLAKEMVDQNFLDSLKKKIVISFEKHHSKGIIVHGHQECAGNPVDDASQIADIKKSVEVIKQLIGNKVPVIGVFVKRENAAWVVEELSP